MRAAPDASPPLFQSFWLAGFEAASHVNGRGVRVDMVGATQHDQHVIEDYALLQSIGIQAAREGIRWHLVERDGAYDFSSLAPIVTAARERGIQVLWTLCHYGWPDDVDVFSPDFISRFARYCAAVAGFIAAQSDTVPVYSPINEISFLAFAAGDVGWFSPFAHGRGFELKRQLVQATITGIEAIWTVDSRARIVHVDPAVHVMSPEDRPDLVPMAHAQRASQFEAWDMLAGRMFPELGGHPRYLDILGANFYYNNQWVYPDERIPWETVPRDPRWLPLHQLLGEVYARYQRPMFVAETGHYNERRGRWLREVAEEIDLAQAVGVPVGGVCIYPILDRPDWHDPTQWHHSGMWSLITDSRGRLHRVIVEETDSAWR